MLFSVSFCLSENLLKLKTSWLFLNGDLNPDSFCWVGLLLPFFPYKISTNGNISLKIIGHYNEVLQNLGSPYNGAFKNSAFPSVLVLPPPCVTLFCFIIFNLSFSSLKSFHLSSLNTLTLFFFFLFPHAKVFLHLVQICIYLTFFFNSADTWSANILWIPWSSP